MKKIEDIENISLETLESVSVDSEIAVPAGLKDRVLDVLVAGEVTYTSHRRLLFGRVAISAVSFALAAALAVFLLMPQGPKDTFKDPLSAYAEVEKTLAYISSKVDTGRYIAEETELLIEKTVNYSEKIIIR